MIFIISESYPFKGQKWKEIIISRPFEFELSTITSRRILSDSATYLLFKMALFALLFPHSFKMIISSMFEK